jgi:hypothetical protein
VLEYLKAQADFHQLQHAISTQFQSTLRSAPSSQKDKGDIEKAHFDDSSEQAFNLQEYLASANKIMIVLAMQSMDTQCQVPECLPAGLS